VVEAACRRHSAPLLQLGRDVRYRYRPHFGNRDRGQTSSESAMSTVDVEIDQRSWTSVPIPLAGAHQAQNAALALAAVDILIRASYSVPDEAVHAGMAALQWPARIEVVMEHPTVVVDAAHNVSSVQALLDTIRQGFDARKKVLLFAATRDKDVTALLRRLLPEFDAVILTRYVKNPRGIPLVELGPLASKLTDRPFHTAPDPAAAWLLARSLADRDDLICVTGSFFVAGEVREMILEELASTARGRQRATSLRWPHLAETAAPADVRA